MTTTDARLGSARLTLKLAASDDQYQRREAAQARAQLCAAVLAAVDAGMTETEAATLAGVTRMTVRSWRGK